MRVQIFLKPNSVFNIVSVYTYSGVIYDDIVSLAVCARTKHQRQREGRHICYVRLQNRILLLGLFSVDCTFVIWHGHIWVCKRWIINVRDWAPEPSPWASPCLWLYCLFSPMSRRTTHKPLPDFNCNKRLILAVCMILLILVVTCCQAPPPPFHFFFAVSTSSYSTSSQKVELREY